MKPTFSARIQKVENRRRPSLGATRYGVPYLRAIEREHNNWRKRFDFFSKKLREAKTAKESEEIRTALEIVRQNFAETKELRKLAEKQVRKNLLD